MNRLVINPGTPSAWEIELRPGANSIGRGEQNDVPIDHASVSGAHCQIVTNDSGATIKDLGSTNGTFVDGVLVDEAAVQSGQTIRLGSVETRFESDAATPARAEAQSDPLASVFCKRHPGKPASFLCSTCRHALCDLCVNTRKGSDSTRKLCRACGTECVPLHKQVRRSVSSAEFFAQLPGTFGYPFKGNGVILLVGGAVFFLLLGWMPIVGLLVTGYLFSYAKRIIASSAEGKSEPPTWPDFGNWWDDVLVPYGQLIALVMLTFGPAIILNVWRPSGESHARAFVVVALVGGGLLAPMGMLALAMFDTVAALNPVTLVWSILRIPLHYSIAAAVFELVIGANVVAEGLIESLMPVPFLGGAISGFINLYFITVGMRILGLLYSAKQDQLGWFA